MLLVIAYHSCIFWSGNWFSVQKVEISARFLAFFSKWLNSFHIYGFTLVSGYLFYYLKNEKEKYQKYVPFIINKIKRLLVPYCFVAFCWVVPISFKLFEYSLADVIDRYILCTNPSQLWFLWMLFDVFFMIWPLNNIIVKNDLLAVTISLIAWSIGVVGGIYSKNVFCIWTAFKYLPFFVLGMKLREKENCILYKVPKWIYIVLQLSLIIFNRKISQVNYLWTKILAYISEYCIYIVGALLAFLILQLLATNIAWRKSKIFMNLLAKTMPMYLFHQQIIYFTIIYLNGKVNPYINAIVNFIVATILSLVMSNILMKFKWTKRLIGEK